MGSRLSFVTGAKRGGLGLSALLSLGVLSGLGAGCSSYELAAPGPAPLDLLTPPPAGQAKICIVRPQSKVLSFTAIVHDNGHLVGATRGESYFCYLAEPGDHLIRNTADHDVAEADATVAAGQSYYLEQSVSSGFQKLNVALEWVPKEQATIDGRQCRYLPLAGVPHNESLPQIGAVVPALREGSADRRSLHSALPSHGS